MTALSPSLERTMVRAADAAGLVAVPVPGHLAPASLDALRSATWVDDDAHVCIPVSREHSDRTIWSGREANWIFRAWHDWLHLKLSAEMDFDGEIRVAHAHLSAIEGAEDRKILWAETAGQVAFHAAFGFFPRDQRLFVQEFIR